MPSLGLGLYLGAANLTQGGGAWNATRSAFKSQIIARGGLPSDAAQSPTITEGVGAASATLSGATIANTDSRLVYSGGDREVAGPSGSLLNYQSAFSTTQSDGVRGGRCAVVEFGISCPRFEMRVYRTALRSMFRVYVDGKLSTNNYFQTANDGSQRWLLFDFTAIDSNPVLRQIRIEFVGTGTVGGIKLDSTGDIFAPTTEAGVSITYLGDSFPEGTGTETIGGLTSDYTKGWAPQSAKLLGSQRTRISAFGGTGWVKTNGLRPGLVDRISADAVAAASDVYIIAMGINDTADVSAAVASSLDALRAARPSAMIYVVLPWNPSAPTPRSGTLLTVANSISAACAGRGGVKVLDPDLVAYTLSDLTHPDQAGHDTLRDWVVDQIKVDLGIAA